MLKCESLQYSTGSWNANFTFSIEEKVWVGVAGPSGGGKSTLLSVISGFLPANSGAVWLGGKLISSLPPSERQVSMMFQQSSLIPHLTCGQNIELAMSRSKLKAEEKRDEITKALRVACVPGDFLKRMPRQLSGGELARMNLVRTLVRESEWLFLDEPFASIDQDLRLQILVNLSTWRNENGRGILLVSHEPRDAMMMADKLLFVEDGRVTGMGSPLDLAVRPRTLVMARLLQGGNLVEVASRTGFIATGNIFTHQAALDGEYDGSVVRHHLSKFKLMWSQGRQSVVDLERKQLWMLPLDGEFKGDIFFKKADIHWIDQAHEKG